MVAEAGCYVAAIPPIALMLREATEVLCCSTFKCVRVAPKDKTWLFSSAFSVACLIFTFFTGAYGATR